MQFPHLPPPSSSIKAHRLKQIMPAVIIVILVSVLASASISLSVVSWFLPYIAPEANVRSSGRTTQAPLVVDPILDGTIKQSLLSIYDSREKVDHIFYKEGAKANHAVLLSSDGWAVMGPVEGSIQNRKYWEAVDSQGIAHEIISFVDDPLSDLIYFKLSGEGFRVMAFSDWREDNLEQTMWSIEKEQWQEVYLDKPAIIPDQQTVYSVWQPQYVYQLAPAVEPGGVILDTRGQLVGLADEDNGLIPGWMIAGQLPNLLANGEFNYQGLPYKGYLVQAALAAEGIKAVAGFYVAQSVTQATSSTIGAGDLIIEINHEAVARFDLSRQVLLAPAEVLITVLREDQKIDIIVNKAKVKP